MAKLKTKNLNCKLPLCLSVFQSKISVALKFGNRTEIPRGKVYKGVYRDSDIITIALMHG